MPNNQKSFSFVILGAGGRFIRIHGTHGYIEGVVDRNEIKVHLFDQDNANETRYTIKTPTIEGGHGGGDMNLLANLIQTLRTDDPEAVLTSTAASLETHRIVFAAERARREGCVVNIADICLEAGLTTV